jgi:hypothetical protein
VTDLEYVRFKRWLQLYLRSLPLAWLLYLCYLAYAVTANLFDKNFVYFVVGANIFVSAFHLPAYIGFLRGKEDQAVAGCLVTLGKKTKFEDCLACLVLSVITSYGLFLLLPLMQFFRAIKQVTH